MQAGDQLPDLLPLSLSLALSMGLGSCCAAQTDLVFATFQYQPPPRLSPKWLGSRVPLHLVLLSLAHVLHYQGWESFQILFMPALDKVTFPGSSSCGTNPILQT